MSLDSIPGSGPVMRSSVVFSLRNLRWRTLVLATAVLACGDDKAPTGTDGQPVQVSTVLIAGVPTVPLLTGTTVQLAATPVNETGGTLSNQQVTWATSDRDIAGVSTRGLVTAVGAGPVTITATSGGRSGSVTLDVRAGGAIGRDGGTLTMLGGKASIVVPADALLESTTILLAPVATPLQDARLVPGTAFQLAPELMTFQRGATFSLAYDPSRVPAGVPASSLQLYVMSGGVWTQVRGSTVNSSTHMVTGVISRAGVYAIIGTPVDRVTLTGGMLSGALYSGQTAQFSVTTFDALNTVLTGRTVQWTTSDASRATVDQTGKVTAVGAGSVTVTATSEGKSAATTLLVLAGPAADWSQATEWTTYQGNARHTGFVPVVADPVVFTELWVATPFGGGGALNPVTAGAGAVYVSGGSSAGNRVGALDARTGVANWTYAFSVDGVHPPAYANGNVYLTTSGHSNSFLWSFSATTGALNFRSAYGNQWSHYYAPVIVDDAVYMAGGYYDGVYSFGATSGAQRWFANTNQYDQWTPAVADGLVYTYTGSYSPKVTAINAATGVQVFEIPDPKFSWTGWSMGLAPVLGSSNNLLATNGGRLISFDLGAKTIGWEQKASFTGTVTVADGLLYVVNSGQVDVRRESDGSLVGPWVPPEGQVRAPLIVTRNLLFASTATRTYAVDLATRRQVWSYPAAGHLTLSSQGLLLIAQANGKLAAISVK